MNVVSTQASRHLINISRNVFKTSIRFVYTNVMAYDERLTIANIYTC